MENNNILFFMLARGGSNVIPKKNLSEINGISLIGIRENSAISDDFFASSVISTDNDEIDEKIELDTVE